jgi:hypothetical protein
MKAPQCHAKPCACFSKIENCCCFFFNNARQACRAQAQYSGEIFCRFPGISARRLDKAQHALILLIRLSGMFRFAQPATHLVPEFFYYLDPSLPSISQTDGLYCWNKETAKSSDETAVF